MYDNQTNQDNQQQTYSSGDQQQVNAGQPADNAQENHQYRYGRGYYQNQQDSVYHVNHSQNTQSHWNGVGNGEPRNDGKTSYHTYTPHQYDQNGGSYQESGKKKKPHRMWKKAVRVAVSVAVIAVVGAGSTLGTIFVMNQKEDSTGTEAATTIGSTNVNNSKNTKKVSTVSASTAVVTDVSDMVENAMPSLVKITNLGTETYSGFFGQSGSYETESNGSGIIIGQTEEELLVATNQHVVAGAETLQVIFIDEESCEANVKGTDAAKDLAVIAVPLDSIKEDTLDQIKVATLGDSDNLKVGEPAIAIGNALGYGQSVTLGVISALNREVSIENTTNKLIQTDAAINPGNSGGALLNIAGEVIGINSVKYSSTEVEGMGYAIPISDAEPIINELMNKETKTKVDEDKQAYMGISGVDITSDVAKSYNMPQGVYVAQVVKGSPAEKAGIKKGDIITKIADVSVTSFDELKAELQYHEAGSTVEVEIQKQAENSYGYETKTIEVTLSKQED